MKINFLTGIWVVANFVALQCPVLLSNKVFTIILILILTSTTFLLTKYSKLAFFCCIFIVSSFWSHFYVKQQIDAWLPFQLENKLLTVDVKIEDSIHQFHQNHLMIVQFKKDQWQGRALLYLDEELFSQKGFKVGQIWRMTLKLKRPHGLANPYLYRKELFYLESNIQAVASIQQKYPIILISQSQFLLKAIRYSIQEKILFILHDSIEANVISALTLGHIQNFDWDHKQILQKTGTSHLLAISGLHIGLVAAFIELLSKIILKKIPGVFLYLPLPKITATVSIISVLFYAFLSGFSLPTQRAVIMLIVILLARCYSRLIPKWHGFSLALLIVLIFDPIAIISSNFWLSFIAVVTIFLISDYFKSYSILLRLFCWQVLLSVSLLPWTLYFFHGFSLVSIFANIVVVPWIGYVVIPLSLIAIIFLSVSQPLANFLLLIATYNLKLVLHFLEMLSKINWMQWQSSHFSFFIFIIVVFSSLAICYRPLGKRRFVAVVGFIPLFFPSIIHLKPPQLMLYVLDVGQGLSLVIQTKHHTMLYDAGLKIQNKFDAGNTVITPFLQQKGIKIIDRMIISHADNDHSGGARSISEHFFIKELLSSQHKNYVKNIDARWCIRGDRWIWDDIEFEFLHPDFKFLNNENNGSCVLKITNGNISILLPGDIEHEAEDDLVQYYGDKLAAQILIAPHHGSNTSSTLSFINAVKPSYVIISSGYLNRFHFPHSNVVFRYKNLNAKILNTAEVGAISIKINQDKIEEVIAERINNKKFWD